MCSHRHRRRAGRRMDLDRNTLAHRQVREGVGRRSQAPMAIRAPETRNPPPALDGARAGSTKGSVIGSLPSSSGKGKYDGTEAQPIHRTGREERRVKNTAATILAALAPGA